MLAQELEESVVGLVERSGLRCSSPVVEEGQETIRLLTSGGGLRTRSPGA